ncbi:hypothetical protein CANINC_003716 [Pichia inconspicua]|uniref:LSM2-LSM8 complex subunit LSM8 n=1 Tax=Pichia inconspicua TaxID=52247 RepID=A0A4T0WXZ4_9ASCO|nr:hypothetical protein CANINC_003716 [[Candida] inconspicua]
MSALKEFVGEKVKIVTLDGEVYTGKLDGFDNNTNIVLLDVTERKFSSTEPTIEKTSAGLIVRGDSIMCVGTYDEDVESITDYSKISAEKIKDSKNSMVSKLKI